MTRLQHRRCSLEQFHLARVDLGPAGEDQVRRLGGRRPGREEGQGVAEVRVDPGMGRMLGSPDCTPGYYNNEGQDPGPAARLNVGYPAGATAYFKYLEAWRSSGAFEGLAFR